MLEPALNMRDMICFRAVSRHGHLCCATGMGLACAFGLAFAALLGAAQPAAAQFTQQGDKLVGTGVAGTCIKQGCSVALSADGIAAIMGAISDGSADNAPWRGYWGFI
jgi:hypothetical protein